MPSMANSSLLLLRQDATALYGGAMESLGKGLGRMFYMVDPAETTYKTAEDVPFFFRQVR